MYSFVLPLSKSMAARVMICRMLAPDTRHWVSMPFQFPECEDTEYVKKGFELVALNAGRGELYIGDGGTTLRFLLAAFASMPEADVTLRYSRQLAARPIRPLLEALKSIGADIGDESINEGRIRVCGKKLAGGEMKIDGNISSQFISALMLAAPCWENGLKLIIEGECVSWPYVEMTARVMREMGVAVGMEDNCIMVKPGEYSPNMDLKIENDWSAAMLVYELAMLAPGKEFFIQSLTSPERSVQGDSHVASMFAQLGVDSRWYPDGSASVEGITAILEKSREKSRHEPFRFDMRNFPDAVPYMAVGMCLAGIRFRIDNINHLRHKESDRIRGISENLSKMGYVIDTAPNHIAWRGERSHMADSGDITISTFDDHRIAMAFAPAALKYPIYIDNKECVKKSFPGVWKQLADSGLLSD